MKSKMKKVVSLVLAMAMVLTMGVTAFADDTYTITINNEATGHTYEAYQIFSGTLSDGKLTGIDWGTGVSTTTTNTDGDTLLEAIKKIENSSGETPFSSCSTAEDVADVLASNSSLAETFADVVSAFLGTAAATTSTCTSGTYTITVSSVGYYLVKDKDGSLEGEDDAYTDYILQVLGNETINAKSSVPTVEKKVEEINDSTDDDAVWQDAADYDIGDSINYKLTGTMPSTLDDYSTYYYVFTDTLSAGLTVMKADGTTEATVDGTGSNDLTVNDVTVTVYANATNAAAGTSGTVVASGYTVSLTDVTGLTSGDTYYGGTVLTVTIDDVLSMSDGSDTIAVDSNSVIVVTYSAKLNDDANIGSTGNPNEVVLTFSNNPNNAGSSETGKTPEDKVTVFTFKLEVNKTNGTNPLAGAAFTLYKLDSTTNTYKEYATTTAGTDTTFTFTGIDSGKYMIKETKTPDGYNSIDDIYFEVAATYDLNSTDPQLTALVVKDANGNEVSGDENSGKTYIVESTKYSLISTTIVNKAGSTLPSTGGIGTTIFYIVGAILVLGAGVVLVTRRRTAR